MNGEYKFIYTNVIQCDVKIESIYKVFELYNCSNNILLVNQYKKCENGYYYKNALKGIDYFKKGDFIKNIVFKDNFSLTKDTEYYIVKDQNMKWGDNIEFIRFRNVNILDKIKEFTLLPFKRSNLSIKFVDNQIDVSYELENASFIKQMINDNCDRIIFYDGTQYYTLYHDKEWKEMVNGCNKFNFIDDAIHYLENIAYNNPKIIRYNKINENFKVLNEKFNNLHTEIKNIQSEIIKLKDMLNNMEKKDDYDIITIK